VRGEDASNVAVTPIPPQRRITIQILKHFSTPGTRANMITQGIKRKPFVVTCRGRQSGNGGNLRTHSKGEEGLPETGRPSLIPVLRPERTEARHLLVPKYALESPPETRRLPSLSAGRSPRQCRRCAAPCEGVAALKANDWAVEHLADLFRTPHKVKTQQVAISRGQRCGDIALAAYLADAAGPVPLVLDLRIAHERWGSSSNPILNGQLRHPRPADIDRPLNEAAADKIRYYRADYNNRPSTSISFMPAVASTSGRLHCEYVRILLLQAHRKTDRFFAASGVELAQTSRDFFHYRRAAFYSQLKSKVPHPRQGHRITY
jgi:hypothetical protein